MLCVLFAVPKVISQGLRNVREARARAQDSHDDGRLRHVVPANMTGHVAVNGGQPECVRRRTHTWEARVRRSSSY